MKVYISLFLIFILGGCAKQGTTSSVPAEGSYKALAYESLKVEAVEFTENSEGDYVLATYINNSNSSSVLNYVIINVGKKEIVKEGALPQGKINWISDYEVEIFSPPGIPKENSLTSDDYKSTFNVRTGKMDNNKKGASN